MASMLDKAVRKLRDPQTPTWWSTAQVVVGVIFVALFAVALVTNNDPGPVAGGPSTRTGGGPPATTGSSTSTPTTQPSESTTEPSGTVEVLASGGTTKVKIPVAANDLAQRVYAAYHNPQAAASIPTQDGSPFEAEGANDNASVKDVMVSEAEETSVSFIGLVDADGESGPQSSAYRSVTLVNEDDTWKVASY